MLFSATQTTKVKDLARISLRPGPLYVDVDKTEATSTVDTLSQGYVVCPSDRRFLLLFTFLKKHMKKKMIVFFSSCNSVKYHAELLNYIDVPVLDLHVRLSSMCRRASYTNQFCRENKSNRSGQIRSSNSVTRNPERFYAPTSQHEDWISPVSTGSSSMILQTTLEIISTESAVRHVQARSERVSCFFFQASSASYDISRRQRSR